MTVSWWLPVPSTSAARWSRAASTLTECLGSGADGVVVSGAGLPCGGVRMVPELGFGSFPTLSRSARPRVVFRREPVTTAWRSRS